MSAFACPRCGTQIDVTGHGLVTCPNCRFTGQAGFGPLDPVYQGNLTGPGVSVAAQTTNGKAIAALILGLSSCFVGLFVTGIPAIILGVMARGEIRASNGAQSGDGMAVTGIVFGALVTALSLFVFLMVFSSLGGPFYGW